MNLTLSPSALMDVTSDLSCDLLTPKIGWVAGWVGGWLAGWVAGWLAGWVAALAGECFHPEVISHCEGRSREEETELPGETPRCPDLQTGVSVH